MQNQGEGADTLVLLCGQLPARISVLNPVE